MLRKIFLTAFLFALASTTAFAQCGSVPNTLTNGQNADATQVMANFNFLRDCINNAPPPASIDDVNRRNILLNTAMLSKWNAGYVRNINVFADGYKANDGVNASVSSNYTVDVSNGRVSPTSAVGTDLIPFMSSGTTGGVTISTNNEQASYPGWKAADGVQPNAAASDWAMSGAPTVGAPGILTVTFGSGVTAASYQVGTSGYTGFTNANAPKDWKLQGSTDNSNWTDLDSQTNQVTWGVAENRTYTIATPSSYQYYRINITASGSSTLVLGKIQLSSAGTPNNMTLVTSTQLADATVTNGRVLLEYNPVDAITLNTDLTAEVTCNNGTNWTTATLAAAGTAQSGRKVAETADTVCGTSGVQFAARIKTAAKRIQIYRTAVAVH